MAAASARQALVDVRLIPAVKNRDVESVRELLKAQSPRIDVNAAQGDGATALHWAAHRDALAIADLLIRSGRARTPPTISDRRRFTWPARIVAR
ncbi:MAG: ankyrin repeat domain-containing protein [Vicinamibacterales bacterium]